MKPNRVFMLGYIIFFLDIKDKGKETTMVLELGRKSDGDLEELYLFAKSIAERLPVKKEVK